MLTLSFLTVILVTLVQQSSGQICGDKGLKKFDSTFARLVTVGGSGRKFPEDKFDQRKRFCGDSIAYVADVDKYRNKCFKETPRQVTGVIVHSLRSAFNKYCKKDSKALDELISCAPCANKAKKEIDQCYTKVIDDFQGSQNADEKMRVPHICCSYWRFFTCIEEKVGPRKDVCNEKQIEQATDFVRGVFGEVVDILCADYIEGSDKCDKLGMPPKKRKEQRRTKSFMLPLIQVLSEIPERIH